MSKRGGWRWLRRAGLALLLATTAEAVKDPVADTPAAAVFRGACYCRVREALECTADLTERDCREQSTQTLCDDWFWLERRACWNWGYGG